MKETRLHVFYKKPSSVPGSKFLKFFGHILFLKVSYKCLNALKNTSIKTKTKWKINIC